VAVLFLITITITITITGAGWRDEATAGASREL
jgi:hypothetical protein